MVQGLTFNTSFSNIIENMESQDSGLLDNAASYGMSGSYGEEPDTYMDHGIVL